jgi:ABC-type sugar transport system ATPase subunit
MNFLRCSLRKQNGNVLLEHAGFRLSSDDREVLGLLETGNDTGGVILGLRPEDIRIHHAKPKDPSIQAEIYVTEPLGNETIVDIKIGDNVIKVLAESDFSGNSGQTIWITFNYHKLHLFDDEQHSCVYHATDESDFKVV